MDTGALKKFAQAARRQLLEQVAARMEQVLQTDSVEIREKEKVVHVLQEQINKSSKEAVVDRVAYTWFNRFCALRYMDVNHYTRIGIVSPQEGFTQPEILQEAKQGVIDDYFKVDNQKVIGLLNGQLPSSSPQQEAYRLLLVGACNAFHAQMPFLFPKIDDYTELLMPDDLLSENSVLQGVSETLTEDTCQDVEVIGWLYQFYISERKDEVFASKKVIEAKDIPAVTQLFTPHYIVRYLVENTLGRLLMLNYPDSKLVEQMSFYVQPEETEKDFLEILSPEEIKVCDPACGSGHLLTYTFDMLFTIYEEQGYDHSRIPCLILEKNLFGIEIDQRAGHLAAFALMMKAREKDPHFFNRRIEPNICVLENITFTPEEITKYKKAVGQDLFTQELWFLLQQFEHADNFGALICPQVKNPLQILSRLEELGVFDDMFLSITSVNVKKVLKFAQFLAPRYQVVIANPPYLRPSNSDLKQFANDHYPYSRADLGVMFIERNLGMVKPSGLVGMVTMQSWMFLSSYEKFRANLLEKQTILSMAHLGTRAFDSIGGEVVSTTASIIKNLSNKKARGSFFRLIDGRSEVEKIKGIKEAIKNPEKGLLFFSSANDLKKIPGYPITYWVSAEIRNLFQSNPNIGKTIPIKAGIRTGNDAAFLRYWYEVENSKTGFNLTQHNQIEASKPWYPLTKGGGFRKWYGNNEHIVNLKAVENFSHDYRLRDPKWYFKNFISWTKVSGSDISFRFVDGGTLFSDAGPGIFADDLNYKLLGYLNSPISEHILGIINPTLNYPKSYIEILPLIEIEQINNIEQLINISKADWNSFETSWEFKLSPLLDQDSQVKKLEDSFFRFYENWKSNTKVMQDLENECYSVLINSNGIDNEFSPSITLDKITLSCNPHYRYKGNKIDKKLNTLFLADTMKEFMSYAVGCMLGRYSLDKEGLILVNAGETLDDYLRQAPEPTFNPDADNVIPVLAGEWFEDDIAERLKDFLKITFSEEYFDENLSFLEEAIGRDIRSYFVKDFYSHHVKMYKKRPIYWMFSSPKGSFNALIYMHRYRPDTISVILNDYLVQYRTKLSARKAMLENRSIAASASQGEKTKALKEIDKINSVLSELREYEDEILYPLATQQIDIDLDDGVKVNYNKFGKALKKVTGLSD